MPQPHNTALYTEGKIPPSDIAIEHYVLGCALIEQQATEKATRLLKPEVFYKEENRRIFSAISDLFDGGHPVNPLTVTNALRKKQELEIVGGAYSVSALTTSVGSTVSLEYNCLILLQFFAQRELIRIGAQMQTDGFDITKDCFNDIFTYQNELNNLLLKLDVGTNIEPVDRLSAAIKKISDAITSGKPPGIPTGLRAFDGVLGGLHKGKLICFGGRPGNGKTALMMALAHKVATQGTPALYFNMEMEKTDAANREIAMYSGLSISKLNNAIGIDDADMDNIQRTIAKIEKIPLYIDFKTRLDVQGIVSRTKSAIVKYGIEVVFIDYLQIMELHEKEYGTRDIAIGHTTSRLKSLAKELNICVVFGSQLSRETEKRSYGIPRISDLRESGNIEQDTDVIGLLWCPDNYESLLLERTGWDVNAHKDELWVFIEKHRQGSLTNITLKWLKAHNVISDTDKYTSFATSVSDHPDRRIESSVSIQEKTNNNHESSPF